MMFGNRPVLMNQDDGDTGGGGGDDRGFFERGPVVTVEERSFQSPGTTGAPINRDDTFLRGESAADRLASRAAAGFIGALSPIPGTTAFLQSQGPRSFQTDAEGNVLQQGLSPSERALANDSSRDIAASGGNQSFTGAGAGGSNTGDQAVASALELANSRADIAINRALGFQEEAAGLAEASLGEGRTSALDALQGGADRGISALQGGADRGIAALTPFSEAGTTALDRELAFLGLSGADAEQAAFQGFTQSPGALAAQREEEQALVRNALAVGDAGGGRFRDELAGRASSRFSQTLDSRLNRLSILSGRGQQAAGGIANIEVGRGTGIEGIETGVGTGQANIEQNTAANLSNLFLGTGENQASAVLGQEVARAGTASEANRIEALRQQQESQQDADFKSQLFGLAASAFKPAIISFF